MKSNNKYKDLDFTNYSLQEKIFNTKIVWFPVKSAELIPVPCRKESGYS